MIYLDNSATTKPCEAALLAMRGALEADWFNPSAAYGPAVRAEKKMTQARRALLEAAGAQSAELTFTGSGSEADSLAIVGSAERFHGARRVLIFGGEHPAVLNTREQLERLGHTVETFPARRDGVADLEKLAAALDENVGLVSCMQVNNETGAVQPVGEIARLIREKCPGALFHVDGVQGFLRVPLAFDQSGIDLYTCSGHKIHGPKGIGALIARKGVRLNPRIEGGGQEKGLRSGTENTAGIAGFAAAAQWLAAQPKRFETLRAAKLRLYARLRAEIPEMRVNGPDPESGVAAPHILNLSLGVRGEVMLHALEAEGVYVGNGSACSTHKREMSAAFRAMNAGRQAAETAVRFSLGMMNTIEEMDAAADAVIRCYKTYAAFQRR